MESSGLTLLSETVSQANPLFPCLKYTEYLIQQIDLGNYNYLNELINYLEICEEYEQSYYYYSIGFKVFPNDKTFVHNFINSKGLVNNSNSKNIIAHYLGALNNNNPECMFQLGNIYHGDLTKFNLAIDNYKKAIALGHKDAVFKYVNCYLRWYKQNVQEYLHELIMVVEYLGEKLLQNRTIDFHSKFEQYQMILIDIFKNRKDYNSVARFLEIGRLGGHNESLVNLIEHTVNIENNKIKANEYCKELFNKIDDDDYLRKLVEHYKNKSKKDLLELYCINGIRFKKIYCMKIYAKYNMEIQNFEVAFLSYCSLIINSKQTNHINIRDATIGINSIFLNINNKDNSKELFKLLLDNLKFLEPDFPPYNKYIYNNIYRELEKLTTGSVNYNCNLSSIY